MDWHAQLITLYLAVCKQGRIEGAFAEKHAIARNLLGVLDDATIAAKTGLTVGDVARLRGA